MLAFLLHTAASSHLSKAKEMEADESHDAAIYFDILVRLTILDSKYLI